MFSWCTKSILWEINFFCFVVTFSLQIRCVIRLVFMVNFVMKLVEDAFVTIQEETCNVVMKEQVLLLTVCTK